MPKSVAAPVEQVARGRRRLVELEEKEDLPSEVDWVEDGAVAPVQNQVSIYRLLCMYSLAFRARRYTHPHRGAPSAHAADVSCASFGCYDQEMFLLPALCSKTPAAGVESN